MKNIQKGFVGIIILVILALALGIGGTYYVVKPKQQVIVNEDSVGQVNVNADNDQPKDVKTEVGVKVNTVVAPVVNVDVAVSLSIKGNILKVMEGNKIKQTLSADSNSLNIMPSNNVSAFIIDKDVNFDGHNDIGVLSGSGYGGVNYFYDFYIYNQNTKMFDKNSVLSNISNFNVDSGKKEIRTSTKSGPGYVETTYKWNGSTYVKSTVDSGVQLGG